MKNARTLFEKYFDLPTIEKIKRQIQAVDEAQRKDGFKNKLQEDFETPWVGTAGEWTFGVFLSDIKGLKRGQDFEYTTLKNKTNLIDFVIGKHKIDVKTVARNVSPKENYGCDVTKKQYEKIINPKSEINCLVFCSYNLKKNVCSLLGWISKREFIEKATFFPEQTTLNKLVSNTAMYEVPISSLHEFNEDFFVVPKIEESGTMHCYLEGCEKLADPNLTAFCCQEHKDQYNEKHGVQLPKDKLPVSEMQKRVLEMGKTAPKDDTYNAAKRIFLGE